MVHVVVGYGEVGSSLGKVLGKHLYYDEELGTNIVDGMAVDPPVIIHICIPYLGDGLDFKKSVRIWQGSSDLVICHSSVPVGTCDSLGVVHSPICGVHPHLTKGIRTFVKYFGGKHAQKAANIFKKLGLKTRVYKEARITEAMKLWSTTQYGKMIMLEKEIYEWCQKNHLPFEEVYTRSNKEYNEGYVKLGMPQVVRPYLKHVPGKIGGHCILPNLKLLKVKL
jgi:UDP-N-acetyl-D-mannosaminuronate dehydrogenase